MSSPETPDGTGTLPVESAAPAHPRRRWLVAAAVLLVVAATGVVLLRPSPTPAPTADLAARLRDAVQVSAVMADLAELQRIADANGGIRAGGTPGYDASAAYAAVQLRGAGYDVRLDTLQLPTFLETGPGSVTIEPGADGVPPTGPTTFAMGTDFRPMIFSAAAVDLVAGVEPVGYDPSPGAELRQGIGCKPGDFDGVTAGAAFLVLPGPCYRRDQVDNAVAAGAAALIVAYPSWEPGAVLRPTLLRPGVTIPVLGVTHEMGMALFSAAQAGHPVRLSVPVSTENRPSSSVIAETRGGDAGKVLMVGGHLDSVIDGPGINDNGSGAMAVLEVARRLADLAPAWKVRFAFWTGEEIGLYGAFHYVQALGATERSAIRAYLNMDMLGSPKGSRLVYGDPAAAAGSEAISALFGASLDAAGLSWETDDTSGGSDHYAFTQSGIATGGLFSGLDPCYHLACDRLDNVDRALLGQLVHALADVTGTIASDKGGL